MNRLHVEGNNKQFYLTTEKFAVSDSITLSFHSQVDLLVYKDTGGRRVNDFIRNDYMEVV